MRNNYLSRRFSNRWIGIGKIHEFSSRSPDLTFLDFFLWGYVKDIVYAEELTTRKDMKNRIREACKSITPAVLCNVRAFRHRLKRPTKRTCLWTFNIIKCVSWLYWLKHSPVLPSLITKSCLLDRLLLILPSLSGSSSSDLTFTGCIFFWFWFYWLWSKFFGLVV